MATDTDTTNFLSTNMALLKRHHHHIWQELTASPPIPAGEVYRPPSGEPNLRIKDRSGRETVMHDKDAPATRGDDFLNTIPAKSGGFVTILGMGLGHGALAVINHRPGIRHLVIFERNPAIFMQALRHVDLTAILTSPKVILSVSPDPDLKAILAPTGRAMMLEDIHTLRHLPSFSLDPDGYNDLNDRLFQILNKANVEGNTNLYHGRTYLKNRFQNLKTIHHDYLIDKLYNKFQGIPAILVAGGPSLDKNIAQLKEARGKAVIIAVDSTLPTLLAHDAVPDFITTIDPQDLIFEKFADVAAGCRNTSVITMPWVSNKVASTLPAKKVFWAFTASALEKTLASLLGSRILTGGAATVAHLNLQAATILGCSPIIFVGQDLAYTDNKDHAGNTALTHKETMDLALGSGKAIVWADSINGGKVATNRSFFEMKCHFESMIKDVADKHEFINSTEGGVDIKGTRIMPLKETIARYCHQKRDITARIHPTDSDAWHPDPAPLLSAYKDLLAKVTALEKTIKSNTRRHRQALKELRKNRKKGSRLTADTVPESLQKLLITIDNCHKELDRETGIWRLMQEVTLHGIKESEQEKQHIRAIENEPGKYPEWLRESLRCLEKINKVRLDALNIFKNAFEETIKFHQQENLLLSRDLSKPSSAMELARFYYRNDHVVLLDSVINSMPDEARETAEFHFYRGIIAAYWTKFDSAENHFATAVTRDAAYDDKIRRFQKKLAEEYRGYGRNWIIDVKSRRRMLIKGLRYYSDYQPLIDDIRTLADTDLKIAVDPALASPHLDRDDLIRSWCLDIEKNEVFRATLLPAQIAGFYRQLLVRQQKENDISGALRSYSRILAQTPDDPAVHHRVADLLFTIGEFAQGIKHLDKAVHLDPTYAVWWEKIADNMLGTKQYQEALIAYEKCFLALPENAMILKKIGDCHLAMNQPEAAKAAYLSLKETLTAKNTQNPMRNR